MENQLITGAVANPIVDDTLELEQKVAELRKEVSEFNATSHSMANFSARVFVFFALGPRLTRAMGRFWGNVREGDGPVLGPELAQTLDAASKKMIGYKRWMLVLGLLAAVPGMVSIILLWQQNEAVRVTKESTVSNRRSGERLNLMVNLYQTSDLSELGRMNTPIFSPEVRRDAALLLIERDREKLTMRKKQDLLDTAHMVDLSLAPLNGVDFSAIPGNAPLRFVRVGFNGSSFDGASFAGCELHRVWFDTAFLWGASFQGAKLIDVSFVNAALQGADFSEASLDECDFSGALFDENTRWPAGFDPIAAGAKRAADLP